MLYNRELMNFDALMGALSTTAGLVELGAVAVCVLLGVLVARRVYRKLFAHHPERYQRFLPYAGFRLVLPVTAQLLVVLAMVLELALRGRSTVVLPFASAMLFWLSLIRLLTAMLRQAFAQSRFERNTEHFIASVMWLGFVSWALGLDAELMEWMESVSFAVGKSRINLLMISSAILWVSVVVVASLWVSRLIEKRLMGLSELDMSLRIVFAKLARTALMVVAVLIALPIVGIDLTVLSVFGGALGVGLGFGLQKIASNYVSGFIILLDRSIRLGDRLMVENRTGYVTKITSRYIVLKTADGSEALVPNDTLIANTVVNQSYSDKAIWTSVPVQVAYGTDLEQALSLLKQAAEHPRILKDPAPNAFVTLFADSGINLELGFWVADPENGFLGLKSDVNLAIWRLFQQYGISIPFPQREVRMLGNE